VLHQIIDRRLAGKNKSIANRERFLRRVKSYIRRAVSDAVRDRSIKDIQSTQSITIPKKDISEPSFRHGPGGKREYVHPGNADYIRGDKIPRPPGGAGGGGKSASNEGEGQDDFVIDVVRSLRSALGRRIALGWPLASQLREMERQLEQLKEENGDPEDIARLEADIVIMQGRITRIPFIDPFDLRYINRVKQPTPSSKAVMFCLMDVSGSMDEQRKDLSKRFFILLYLFLQRNYEKIEVVFIRHHTRAEEVDEDTFFHSTESGGTVVSSALELMKKIMDERYSPTEWNIYGAQASDGDNWTDDSPKCRKLLAEDILPKVRYFAYIQVAPEEQNLWLEYAQLAMGAPELAMKKVDSAADIYPVFRELFEKQQAAA